MLIALPLRAVECDGWRNHADSDGITWERIRTAYPSQCFFNHSVMARRPFKAACPTWIMSAGQPEVIASSEENRRRHLVRGIPLQQLLKLTCHQAIDIQVTADVCATLGQPVWYHQPPRVGHSELEYPRRSIISLLSSHGNEALQLSTSCRPDRIVRVDPDSNPRPSPWQKQFWRI
jgi:hypothetical protein